MSRELRKILLFFVIWAASVVLFAWGFFIALQESGVRLVDFLAALFLFFTGARIGV